MSPDRQKYVTIFVKVALNVLVTVIDSSKVRHGMPQGTADDYYHSDMGLRKCRTSGSWWRTSKTRMPCTLIHHCVAVIVTFWLVFASPETPGPNGLTMSVLPIAKVP
jgi:hypothetical protein